MSSFNITGQTYITSTLGSVTYKWTGQMGWVGELMDGWMDWQMNRWVVGCMHGWMDRWMDLMDGWMKFNKQKEHIVHYSSRTTSTHNLRSTQCHNQPWMSHILAIWTFWRVLRSITESLRFCEYPRLGICMMTLFDDWIRSQFWEKCWKTAHWTADKHT